MAYWTARFYRLYDAKYQNYLKRLVINEGNFAEQVEDKRAQYNMTARLETIENETAEFDETADIEYEGEVDIEDGE